MPATKAERTKERDKKKSAILDALNEARDEVNDAKSAADVDKAIKKASDAAKEALDLATEAFKKATAPDHTSEDEDVQVELGDFATKTQIAAQTVQTEGEKKKADSGW